MGSGEEKLKGKLASKGLIDDCVVVTIDSTSKYRNELPSMEGRGAAVWGQPELRAT